METRLCDVKVVVDVRFSVLEQRLTSRAFALALDPGFDTQAVSQELVDLADGNRRALERVRERIHAAADPPGQVTVRILGALRAALESPETSGSTTAQAL
jgi:hypothetical protein